MPAAPDANGARRTLADVTTRIVHGRDAITIVPPWPLYVHVGERIHLGHADRVPVDEFTGNPTLAAKSPQWGNGAVWQFKQAILGDNWRFGLQRFALYASLFLPANASARLLSQLAPILGEAVVRSFLHHKSARYLNFFPVTEIGRGLNRARSFVQPKPEA